MLSEGAAYCGTYFGGKRTLEPHVGPSFLLLLQCWGDCKLALVACLSHSYMYGNCCVSITPAYKEGFSDEVPVGEGRKIIWHGISWVWTFLFDPIP